MSHVSRRNLIKTLGAIGAASVVSGVGAVETRNEAQALAAEIPSKALGTRPEAYTFFTTVEAVFVEAAVSRLIPADELGPGAREAGVAFFIDQQLSGAYGTGAKWYMQGPWGESIPEQGYQLSLAPQQVYRVAIAAANTYCMKTYKKTFDQLTSIQQDTVLQGLERGTIALDGLSGPVFFGMLLGNTIEGFFADPVYGGNRDKVGWRLVGFPGVAATYITLVDTYNKPYRVEPVSLGDVAQGKAKLNPHGHPIHQPLASRITGGGNGDGNKAEARRRDPYWCGLDGKHPS